MSQVVEPIHTFILKVASRCNINCSYCFVYNKADSNWRQQPKLMSESTARQAAVRIREHCERHDKPNVSIVYHGGEPLLGGATHLSTLSGAIREAFQGSSVEISFGMQSNGLLITDEIVSTLRSHKISIGISCDGPPGVGDLLRIDHAGNQTGRRLEEKLRQLMDIGPDVFTGFLAVVNIQSNPAEVYDYLCQFKPKSIDFLLPYDNHSRYPAGKASFASTEYGHWLIRLYDHWMSSQSPIRIRWLMSIMQLLLGGRSLVESVGLDPVDLIVVESNGEIEAVDSLKAAANGATWLGFNVWEHSFDDALTHAAVIARQAGLMSLCATCQSCDYSRVCGGGYVPNRFELSNGFDNPSVYCSDMKLLIGHIRQGITRELQVITS